ncbi:MAG TPA: hypothetical protein VHV47_14220, partial [Opitutaceae bacterium]|nr:hypothetical protein [Opitutaceae bacterium]
MLYDRPYMREFPSNRRTSPLTWLMCALVAAFLMQMVAANWFGAEALVERQFAVTVPALRHWHLWVLLTGGFLHSPVNILHIVG